MTSYLILKRERETEREREREREGDIQTEKEIQRHRHIDRQKGIKQQEGEEEERVETALVILKLCFLINYIAFYIKTLLSYLQYFFI